MKIKLSSKWLSIYTINGLIVLSSCGLMLNTHFSADTYDILTTFDNNVDIHLRDGRFITAGIYRILAILNINVAKYQNLFSLLFMALVAGLVTFLVYTAANYLHNEQTHVLYILNCGFLSIFHNVFIAEWYMFPEAMLMYAISLLGAVIAAISLLRAFFTNAPSAKCKCYGLSFTALLIALGTYQVTIGIYINLLLSMIFICNDMSLRDKLSTAFKGLCMGAFNCILNILIVKLLTMINIMQPSSRGASFNFQVILNNISLIISQQTEILGGHHIFPSFVLPLFIVLLLGVIVVSVSQQTPHDWSALAIVLLFSAIIYAGSFIPHIVSSDYWLSQRTLVPIFGVFAFLIVAGIALCYSKNILHLLLFFSTAFVLINSLTMTDIFSNRLAVDDFDTAYAKAIQSYIQRYSDETGIIIHSIAMRLDSNPSWSYDGIKYVSYDINVKNMVRSWAYIPLINRINNTNYQFVDMNEEVWNTFFAGKDWNEFLPDEQIIFQNDIAYLAVY